MFVLLSHGLTEEDSVDVTTWLIGDDTVGGGFVIMLNSSGGLYIRAAELQHPLTFFYVLNFFFHYLLKFYCQIF